MRAVAALMVIWCHVAYAPPPWGGGGAGVWLFFLLSGYLLFPPLVVNGRPSPRELAGYLVKRLCRLMPLYWCALPVFAYLFIPPDEAWEWLARNAVFEWAGSLFWTQKQELNFYVLLPFVALGASVVPGRIGKGLAVLGVGVVYWQVPALPKLWTLRLSATSETQLIAFAFLLGAALSLLVDRIPRRAWPYCLVVGAVLIWLANIQVDGIGEIRAAWFGPLGAEGLGFRFPQVMTLICAVFLIGAIKAPQMILGNPVLRTLGVWGYGLYIWHMPVVTLVAMACVAMRVLLPPAPILFVIVVALTALVSAATYVLIERPCIMLGRRLDAAIRTAAFWEQRFGTWKPAAHSPQ